MTNQSQALLQNFLDFRRSGRHTGQDRTANGMEWSAKIGQTSILDHDPLFFFTYIPNSCRDFFVIIAVVGNIWRSLFLGYGICRLESAMGMETGVQGNGAGIGSIIGQTINMILILPLFFALRFRHSFLLLLLLLSFLR